MAGIFQRFQRTLQEVAMLRIHDGSIFRRDSPEGRIKMADLIQHRAGFYIVRILKLGCRHSSSEQFFICEEVNRLHAVAQVRPELGRILRAR